jgi:hypothetical protein
MKHCSDQEKNSIKQDYNEHLVLADSAYKCKEEDKALAVTDETKTVLVFDLQV